MLVLHPDESTLNSDWSVNNFGMGVYENFFSIT